MDVPVNVPNPPPRIEETKRDVDNFASAHAPLLALLAKLPTSLPPVQTSSDYKIYLNKDGSFAECDPVFEKGTTAIGFIFDEGIMVSADHQRNVLNSAQNLVELNSHMLAVISGGGEFFLHALQKMCYEHEQKEEKKALVTEALMWLGNIIRAHKEELPIAVLIAAWDVSRPALYRINNQGVAEEDSILATGSGSFGTTVLDCRFKSHMSVTEAADLARRAICVAAYRAPHSGDIFSVYHVGHKGCNKLDEGDIEEWQEANIKSLPKWKYVVIGPGW